MAERRAGTELRRSASPLRPQTGLKENQEERCKYGRRAMKKNRKAQTDTQTETDERNGQKTDKEARYTDRQR